MSEILVVLDKVQTLIAKTEDNGNLDLAVALTRLTKAVKAEMEVEFDRHIEQQAAYWLFRQGSLVSGD